MAWRRALPALALTLAVPHLAFAQSLALAPRALAFGPASAAAAPRAYAPATAASRSAPGAPALISRSDAWFLAAAATGVALMSAADQSVWAHASAPARPDAKRLAGVVRPLGTPQVVGPSLVAGYLAGRIANAPELSEASARAFVSIGSAVVACEAVKLAVGRERPFQSPGDADEFRPFSGDASFPSGHTTLAFATATALDRETDAAWVPWVAYPTAALVGWSRIQDDEHWASDVLAGAALGWFVSNKAENLLRRRTAAGDRLTLVGKANARAHSFRLAARLRF